MKCWASSSFKDLFIGHDPRDIERHARILDNLSFHYSRYWPLDLALWDLIGKLASQPVWQPARRHFRQGRALCLLRHAARRPPPWPRSRSAICDEGFKAMKIRFHRGDWRDDIKALEAVRKAVGDRLDLMVDCNQGWRMVWDIEEPWKLKDARAVARELEHLGVYWMEEPCGAATGRA